MWILLPVIRKTKLMRAMLVEGKRFIQGPAFQEDEGLFPVLKKQS